MVFELIVLALATAVRPSSLAAVYTLLTRSSPRRLMVAYLLAGVAFTVGFSLLVIWVFHGIAIRPGSRDTTRVGEIVGGIIFVIFGVLLLTGRIGGSHARKAPRPPSRWTTLFNQRVTVRTAALAGPATRFPGSSTWSHST